MIYIYRKNVGGRKSDRYFREWDNAKNALLNELEDLKSHGWEITRTSDYVNVSKGSYEYGFSGVTDRGEKFSLSLIESYFED